MVKKFNVTGMSCSACSASVEKAIKKLDVIRFVNVNLLSKNMTVDFDETRIDTRKIIKSVEDTGYGAFLEDAKEDHPLEMERNELGNRFLVSFVFLIPLMYVSMGHMLQLPLPAWMQGISNAVVFTLVQLLLTLPIIYINRKYYQVGFKTLFHGSPNMDSLIALGSGAALIYGIFAIFR
ncbi:MAG: cation transporter, partial [Eubacteriales bacterium]|nr:cation transporter [Eubacteriales bacterium]